MVFGNQFLFGADYYPEHWPEERWDRDSDLMKEAGFNVVRLAEFAWSRIEPKNGQFNFDWLDKVIEKLSKRDIKVIIGTPTAAPPPWIVKAHPDVIRVDAYGRKAAAGTRKNYCPNNKDYIRYSKRIAEKMALHYESNPNVIGWQIDNEFGGEPCYCEDCIEAFREWLKEKYGSLDRLNGECGLIFWGQEYGDWDEILPPRPPFTMQNPSLNLEWHRFTSDSWIKYQQIQVEVIRKYAPHQFVTHNFMGLYKEIDYFKLAQPLDFVSFDYYPKWSGEIDYALRAMSHDVMRSLKKKPYLIMELQSGAVKSVKAPIPRLGEIRLWTIQSVARGADGVLYFRWRTCRFGAEEYWHGILDHDGVPRRRYREVKKAAEDLRKITPHIEGTYVKPEVAIVLIYENIWALDVEVCHGDVNYYGMNSWKPAVDGYRVLYERNIQVDFVDPTFESLDGYRMLFIPSLMLMNPEIEGKLKSYVKNGGILIATPRTSAKDWNNKIVEDTLPGGLSDMFGATIEEYTGLPDNMPVEVETVEAEIGTHAICRCENWMEMLSPIEARPIAFYRSGIYRNRPAAIINDFGEGTAVYIGCFADGNLYSTVIDWLVKRNKVTSVLPAVKGLEATKRVSMDEEIFFALNHNEYPIKVSCGKMEFEDLLENRKVKGTFRIEGLDVRILKAKH